MFTSPTGRVDGDLSCARVSLWSLDHLKKSLRSFHFYRWPQIKADPITTQTFWMCSHSTGAVCVWCVCVRGGLLFFFFFGIWRKKETVFSVPGQSVGGSQPSCHAVQGVVIYDWLRVKAGKPPPCSSWDTSRHHMLVRLPVFICVFPSLANFLPNSFLNCLHTPPSVCVPLPLGVSVSRD